jgi:hypothetical protein
MAEPISRTDMIRRILAAAERDSRIVGVIDYGSSGEGRAWARGPRRDSGCA